MSVRSVQALKRQVLNNGPVKNFITTSEAKALVKEVKKGRVTSGELASLQALAKGWSYYDDKLFGWRTKPMPRPTLSMNAGGVLFNFLRENGITRI